MIYAHTFKVMFNNQINAKNWVKRPKFVLYYWVCWGVLGCGGVCWGVLGCVGVRYRGLTLWGLDDLRWIRSLPPKSLWGRSVRTSSRIIYHSIRLIKAVWKTYNTKMTPHGHLYAMRPQKFHPPFWISAHHATSHDRCAPIVLSRWG